MQLSAGDILGPYEILAPLGAGGMGEVRKAFDPRLNRTRGDQAVEGTPHRALRAGSQVDRGAESSDICQAFDIGPDYLVLEYIEGHPLRGP